jgi:hypothetical protein
MGLVIAIIVLPIVFTLVGVYVVLKLAFLLLRLLFAPVLVLRRG